VPESYAAISGWLEDMIDDAVDAAVLLLERMLKTELRLVDAARRRCSGECMPSVWSESVEHCDADIESGTDVRLRFSVRGESIDDCLERDSVSFLWNANIAQKLGHSLTTVHKWASNAGLERARPHKRSMIVPRSQTFMKN